jgi:hypothetical protein
VPTYAWLARFRADFERFGPAQQAAFLLAVQHIVQDMNAGHDFRQGLRVKGVQGAPGIFEMTWAPDGRATFEYGDEVSEGQPHIVWRRVGTQVIFNRP